MNVKFISLTFLLALSTNLVNAQQVIKLYSGKAPGSERWNWEEKENSKNVLNTRVVYNVVQPTLTAYFLQVRMQTVLQSLLRRVVLFIHCPSKVKALM